MDIQGQGWAFLNEQKEPRDKILLQNAATSDNSLDRQRGPHDKNLYDFNSSNISSIGANVMTPPSNRHIPLTASLE